MAMDFFEHQEVARRATRRLIILFVIAVIAVVVAVNLVATFIYGMFVAPGAALPGGLVLLNTLLVVALIGGGTAYEMNALRAGGQVVARMIGAREVDPSTRDLLDRRFFNVVEEMAIAAGVPVPRAFVMDDENSINAFAAGHSINDAVIAVTRGTLTRLTRDELQGVVAHEFSHILNGDMRLNMRLLGVLFGLMVVALAGRFLLEIGGRSRGGGGRDGAGVLAAMLAAGVALWLLGYIGVFFGRLIKAAVSRQREYLADASAVQFTRNLDGIGGALRKIGGLTVERGLGTKIEHPQAETLSHMFLGAARSNFARGLLATHPPLDDRLRRLYGRKVEFLAAPEEALALAMTAPSGELERDSTASFAPVASHQTVMDVFAEMPSSATGSPLASLMAVGAAAEARVAASVGTASIVDSANATSAVEQQLHDAATDASQAQVLVLALLVEVEADLRAQQRQIVAEACGAYAAERVDQLHQQIQQLPPGARQPLADVAMPALRKLPANERARLLKTAHLLIAADGRVTIAEFLLFTILQRRLRPNAGQLVSARYSSAAALSAETSLVLSLVALLRLPARPEHAFNAGALLVPGADLTLVPADAIRLDAVSAALDRLNELQPLAKPQLIKAVAAVAFVDGTTQWKAASALRMVCAALDAPLPPQLAPQSPTSASTAAATR